MAAIDNQVTGTISDETIDKCLRVLEVWMNEHPECDVICEVTYIGERAEHKLMIKRRGDYGEK